MGENGYPIKGWLVYGTNLMQSLPNPAHAQKAIQALDFIATIDVLPAEIAGWSDLVLKVDAVGNHLLPNLMQAPLGATGGAGFGWNDMTAYKAGVQWKASPNWTLRGGYSHANQPIPESEVLFNILAPGVIQDHLTAGFTTPVRGGNFNFALMYALDSTVTGSDPLEAPGAQQIELKMNEWEAEFSYSFRF